MCIKLTWRGQRQRIDLHHVSRGRNGLENGLDRAAGEGDAAWRGGGMDVNG